MKLLIVLAAVCALALAEEDKRIKYNGFKVISVNVETQSQLDLLKSWEKARKVHFWTHAILGAESDIMLSPSALRDFNNMARLFGMTYSVKINDVQELIDQEYNQRMAYKDTKVIDWKHYNTYEEIVAWLDATAAEHLHVQNHVVGKSTEGRDLMVLRINTGEENSKPKVWLDFGIHAREWISIATGTYIINELVNNPENKDLLDKFEIQLLAIHNPDGYAYSHEANRMWRKTRSYFDNPYGCVGTDANRNWDHHWGEVGSSDHHCDEDYHGPEPFSEVETKLLSEYQRDQHSNSKYAAFFTLHSYSQFWMTPWGYTGKRPDDYDDLMVVANLAAKAIKDTHGKTFKTGTITEVIYPAAGSNADWAHGELGIKYCYALELRDQGQHGFLLPPEQIIPASEETWAGISTALRAIAKEF